LGERFQVEALIATNAATISVRIATTQKTSHQATRHLAKPISAITMQVTAMSSAIDACLVN
jgi:hypothetical protein